MKPTKLYIICFAAVFTALTVMRCPVVLSVIIGAACSCLLFFVRNMHGQAPETSDVSFLEASGSANNLPTPVCLPYRSQVRSRAGLPISLPTYGNPGFSSERQVTIYQQVFVNVHLHGILPSRLQERSISDDTVPWSSQQQNTIRFSRPASLPDGGHIKRYLPLPHVACLLRSNNVQRRNKERVTVNGKIKSKGGLR